MSIGVITLVALVIAIIVSCISPINIGFLTISFAYIIGCLMGGITFGKLITGFPTSLFIILSGVTLLFAQAQTNGTLEKITQKALSLAKGKVGLLPIIIFLMTFTLASLGPGNIAMIALIAPVAMALAGDAKISALMMAVMVVNGASAGALSPIAPTGIVSNMLTDRLGLPDMGVKMYVNSLLGNFAIGMLAYVLFGGLKLWKQDAGESTVVITAEPFTTKQSITVVGILILVASVLFLNVNVGMGAFIIATIFSITGIAEEGPSVKAMPWNAIMMVCGVSMFMELANTAGGLDIFTSIIAQIATPFNVTAVLGFISGAISAYSSSSGVVMPAFIPLVPGLIEKMGGGDPIAMVSAINLSAHVVDASPLSIGGALCIACAADWVDKKKLFRQLIIWGLSMSVVGATVSWLFFTVLSF